MSVWYVKNAPVVIFIFVAETSSGRSKWCLDTISTKSTRKVTFKIRQTQHKITALVGGAIQTV